jgi:hypothetical protein
MKIPRWQHRAGSIPAPGTKINNLLVNKLYEKGALVAAFFYACLLGLYLRNFRK